MENGGNPNHGKDGKFVSGPNQANGSSYENKLKKAFGIDVTKPKYKQVDKHIEIKEGNRHGESYDNLQDYSSSVRKEDEELKDRAIKMFQSLNVNPEKYDDKWFDTLPKETKELLKKLFEKEDTNKALNDLFNQKEHKERILKNYKKHLPIQQQEMVSDLDFENMSLKDKQKYFDEGE